LVGTQWPFHLLIIPLLAGLAGAIAFGNLAWVIRRTIAFRGRTRDHVSVQSTQSQIRGA
jgi:hypothetical protein